MPEARFLVEIVGGVPVVAAPEEIDITNAAGLRAALLDASSNGYRRFVLDMTRTRFCDVSGTHVLAAAHRRALAEDRQLLLAVSNATVLRIFALVGIDPMIQRFASLDEALGHAADGSRAG
jgi:anti-sigma B factor antagonist